MKVFYDLHMHSCLSPCGSDDMTPNNLVNMSALAGLQVIALSDHNTTRNVPAAMKVGEHAGVLVVPAMELTTKEDIHVLCLFPTAETAEEFRQYVYERLPQRKNRPKAFGHQYVMDENDEIIEEEPQLLAFGSSIGIYETRALLEQFGGLAIPAHIDRSSYSLIGVMGLIDPEMGFSVYETTRNCDQKALMEKYRLSGGFIANSDAHDLTAIADGERTLEIAELTPAAVIEAVKRLGEK
ncbi:MAG: PHP domain-containing protein [Oscillospiraceae bacterium]|nr:PHP domain-containing protein [Oscillospiraceae bacterium]